MSKLTRHPWKHPMLVVMARNHQAEAILEYCKGGSSYGPNTRAASCGQVEVTCPGCSTIGNT